MIKIFIPEIIYNTITLNTFSEKEKQMLLKVFPEIKIKKFSEKFLSGTLIKTNIFDKDLFVYANGKFGKKYFYDFDFLEYSTITSGLSFFKHSDYKKNLEKITEEISNITNILNSDKLLTQTKKDEIREKIETSFFTISGIYFSLYRLLEKTEKNLGELKNIKGEIEYESEGKLLEEINNDKKIKLEIKIKRLENQMELFFDIISKIFIK